MSTVEARNKAQARYDKEHATGVYLKLNKKYDADILAWLAKMTNRQGYIKELIRKDMGRE